MRSTPEELYLKSPAALRAILLSAKGLLLERERRGGEYAEFRAELSLRRSWSLSEFETFQESSLAALLHEAVLHVPYYRERIAITTAWTRRHDFLAHVPFLEKEAVRADPSHFVDERIAGRDRLTLLTSGSTGTPLRITATTRARRLNYAFFDDYLESIGITRDARRATIGGRLIIPTTQQRPPFWVRSLVQPALFLSAFHLSDRNLPHYVRALQHFRPEFIDCYPSAGNLLASHMLQAGIRLDGVKAVLTSSETLTPEQRRNLEAAFGCSVYDQYGCAEMAIFAGQCRKGRYHVRSDYGLVEILVNGRPAEPGAEGDVVCTGFVNPAMPLIRYRIGDTAAWDERECTCGLNTPILSVIHGRRDDVVITNDGRRVARLGRVFYDLPIIESQIIQDEEGHVTVTLVPAATFRDDDKDAMLRAIRARLGNDIPIAIRLVTEIERGPGGKLRTVISHYREPS